MIKWLTGITIASLIGIIALQAYFTYNDYQSKIKEFRGDIREIFAETVEEERNIRIDSALLMVREIFADSSRVIFEAKYDEEEDRTIYSLKDYGDETPYSSLSFSDDSRKLNFLDSLNRELTIDKFVQTTKSYFERGVVYYWTKKVGKEIIDISDSVVVDTVKLSNLYQDKLAQRNIYTSFSLKFYDATDSLTIDTTELINSQILQTGVKNGSGIHAFAIMDNPFKDIIRRARITLFGSLLIILVTAACFVIMLRIIMRQKKLSQIKDDFIDNITHELKTPIATLMAANEALDKYNALDDREKTRTYLTISRQELLRLSSMVDNVLLSSIHNRKKPDMQLEQIEIDAFIQELIRRQQVKSGDSVAINYHNSCVSSVIQSDPVHLRHILDNLIDNAIKYNDKSDTRIDIIYSSEQDHFKLTVKDNGPGIATEHQEKIFDKFYRIPPEGKAVNGYGIGLFYVKNIIAELKGSISMNSQQGEGTSFTIILPHHGLA